MRVAGLAAAVTLYLALAWTFAQRKTPWVDEGWIASAPANWARTGSFGTPSLQPTGSWLNAELTGIREITYWNFPVGIAAQALWFKAIGFSLAKLRGLSIVCGAVALLCWAAIFNKLSGDRRVGVLAALLLSIDFTFLWSAADGRMDMMCVALGAGGLAAYLHLREHRFERALWVANTLLALSLFTHPNGILFVLAFIGLYVYYDRARIGWSATLRSLLPYLTLAAMWGTYALRQAGYFVAQLGANSNAIGGARWAGVLHPLRAIGNEVLIRYLAHYGLYPLWAGEVPVWALWIPVGYWVALAGGAAYAWRRGRELRPVVALTLGFLFFMTFFVGLKAQCYLVLIVPLYAGVAAAVALRWRDLRGLMQPITMFAVAAAVGCNAGTVISKLQHNPYASEFLPTVEFVRHHLAPGARVTAESYFGFGLGFDRVNDDVRLGYYSRFHTQYVVADLWYRFWWRTLIPSQEPEVDLYVRELLKTNYRVVFERGPFRVYERRGL